MVCLNFALSQNFTDLRCLLALFQTDGFPWNLRKSNILMQSTWYFITFVRQRIFSAQLSSEFDCFLNRDRSFQGCLTVKFTEQSSITFLPFNRFPCNLDNWWELVGWVKCKSFMIRNYDTILRNRRFFVFQSFSIVSPPGKVVRKFRQQIWYKRPNLVGSEGGLVAAKHQNLLFFEIFSKNCSWHSFVLFLFPQWGNLFLNFSSIFRSI